MKIDTLTPQQQKSLATDRNIAVTAGAGKGKTKILVERYIHVLLNENVDIKEVLAITFTDKAAAEMMDRVAKRIDQLLDSELSKTNKSKLFQIKNRLHSAQISTIHAFCSRLLRENPIEAGIDPEFKTLNDFQNTILQNSSIEEVLELINPDRDKWIEVFRTIGLNNIYTMLNFALEHRYEMDNYISKNQNKNPQILYEKLIEFFLISVQDAIDSSQLKDIDTIIHSLPINEFDNAKQNPKGARVVENIELYLQSEQNQNSLSFWQGLFNLAQIFTTTEGKPYTNLAQLGTKKSWSASTAQMLIDLSEKFVPVFNWISNNPSIPPCKTDVLFLSQSLKFYELYQLVLQQYSQKKEDLTSLDFEDMQIFALNLLKNNVDVCEKIAQQFKYIMVDEFQDTNILQWEIISKLGDFHEHKFFVVGDPKQSIYGFRNADVRVFNEVKKQFASSQNREDISTNITLMDSFRFKENLNSFINHIFDSILSVSENNPWEVQYDALQSLRQDNSGGEIELAVFPTNDSTDLQPEFIAQKIDQIVKQTNFKYGHIAILLRTRNHLNEIEETLRNNAIPFKTIGGIGFYQRQEIYDIYHLIQFLVNPHNDLALISVLRSPFANITDEALFYLSLYRNTKSYWTALSELEIIDEGISKEDLQRLQLFRKQAERWLLRRDRIEFSELLQEIVHECFYQVSMLVDFNGEQLFANLQKIIRIAEENEKTTQTSLVDFAESLKKLINSTTREGEAQAELEDVLTVKVMTVHQAKGLEFPIVIHPYLEQQKTAFRDNCFFDEQWGIISNINSFMRENKSFYLYELAKYKQQQKELAELKRLFYVACSRAKDQLILTSSVPKDIIPKDTPLQWLTESLNISYSDIQEGNFKNVFFKKIKICNSISTFATQDTDIYSKAQKSLIQIKESESISEIKTPYYLEEIYDEPKEEVFSATQLMTFIKDKISYRNRYHLGFFEEDYEKLITSDVEQDLAIIKGKVLHKYLELYPGVTIESLLFEQEITNPDFINELKHDLYIFEERIKKSPYLLNVLNTADYKNEVVITMKLANDFLTGTIDRMYKNEKGDWEVLDYKTNKIAKNQVQNTGQKYNTQIEVYALLLSSVFTQQESYTVTLYFIQPDDIYRKTYNKKDIEKIENRLIKTINEIKQFYPYTNKNLIPK